MKALTSEGTPAIHLAKLAGHADIATLLLAHGYEPPRLTPISPALKDADAASGKSVFDNNCAGCHRLTENSDAPALAGIVGRAKASIADQGYCDALKASGGIWNYEELNAFIANPVAAIPGTAMSFRVAGQRCTGRPHPLLAKPERQSAAIAVRPADNRTGWL